MGNGEKVRGKGKGERKEKRGKKEEKKKNEGILDWFCAVT